MVYVVPGNSGGHWAAEGKDLEVGHRKVWQLQEDDSDPTEEHLEASKLKEDMSPGSGEASRQQRQDGEMRGQKAVQEPEGETDCRETLLAGLIPQMFLFPSGAQRHRQESV